MNQGYILPAQDETRLKESEKFALLTKMCEQEPQQKSKMVLNSKKLSNFSGIYARDRSSIQFLGTLTINNY